MHLRNITDDITQCLTDPAGAPGAPSIGKITPTTIDLSWTRPANDGGALNGYSVEAQKEGQKEWIEVSTTTEQ